MDTRKKLIKPRQDVATISKRIQTNRLKAGNDRNNRFALNRNLVFSPSSPMVHNTKKISDISNKKDKLLAWRTERNRVKFKETVQKRSPFQTVVPVGRFLSPKLKNPTKISSMSLLNKTPIRNMLMNQKVLKKSTIKEAIKTATTGKKAKPETITKTTVISRKRILADISVIPSYNNVQDKTNFIPDDYPDTLVPMEDHLEDSTFKIKISEKENASPENKVVEKEVEIAKTVQKLRRSKSLLEIPRSCDPGKNVVKKFTATKVVVNKEQKDDRNKIKSDPSLRAAKVPVKKVVSKAVIKKVEKVSVPTINVELTTPHKSIPKVNAKKAQVSRIYQLYKSSLESQRKYIATSIEKFSANENEFMEELKEDVQLIVKQTLNQGKKFLNDKFKVFEDLLEKFEAERLNIENSNRITDEDVENHWSLLYAEIRKHNVAMLEIYDIKNETIRTKQENDKLSVKKRRSNFANVNCTPRRSMRVAVAKGTPKHSTICLACTPVSASKVNTPKSRKRSVIKSVIFVDKHDDSFPGTPKRRNSSKRYKATPKVSLAQLNADIDDEDDVFG